MVGAKSIRRQGTAEFRPGNDGYVVPDSLVRLHLRFEAAEGVELRLQKSAVMQALPKGTIKGI